MVVSNCLYIPVITTNNTRIGVKVPLSYKKALQCDPYLSVLARIRSCLNWRSGVEVAGHPYNIKIKGSNLAPTTVQEPMNDQSSCPGTDIVDKLYSRVAFLRWT